MNEENNKMLNYQKIQSIEKLVEEAELSSFPRIKTKDIIKFNLSVAYFIGLTFLLIKLILT